MKEKNFQQEFKTKNIMVGVFELKLCKGKNLPFSNIANHQIKALQNVSSGAGLYHKLTDQPVSIHQKEENNKMRFTRPAPFDCFFLRKTPAYLVIMFYVPRGKKNVYYIHIDRLTEMIVAATRKSMTEEMAAEYACRRETYLKKTGKGDT